MCNLAEIPTVGWIVISIFGVLVVFLVLTVFIGLLCLLFKKNIKTKFFETSSDTVKPEIKERYIAEGKDLIDNQSQVAKLMLKGGRTRLYEIGLEMFKIEDVREKIILELITYRIADRLNYELKNDFTRNHITSKTDYELEQYSNAKSKAYYSLIKERLYVFNQKLPKYNLPDIMKKITLDETKALFKDIYFSARGIAGGKKND